MYTRFKQLKNYIAAQPWHSAKHYAELMDTNVKVIHSLCHKHKTNIEGLKRDAIKNLQRENIILKNKETV